MARILMTGCSGFLSYYLIKDLEKEGNHLIFGITEIPDFHLSGCRVFQVDIRDADRLQSVLHEVKPELIFHLAAISNVGFCWKNQKLTYEVNIIGSSNLIELTHESCPEARIVLVSSAELYGKEGQQKINESSPVVIQNPYALSKWAMEMIGDLYINSRGMDIIKIRSFNFTGPDQNTDFVCSDFAHQIAQIEAGKKEPIIRVGNLSAIRDISDVRDISRYLVTIADRGKPGQIYNLCSGFSHSIQEILDILLSFSKKKIEVVVDKARLRPVDTPVLAGDCSLIRDEFNLTPEYNIHETLKDILSFWRRNLK